MLPIRTILCPVDFSESSQLAFRLACVLARDYGARLIVLHVAAPPPAIAFAEMGVAYPVPEEDTQALEKRLHGYQPPHGNLNVEHCLREGDPITEILSQAQHTAADVIVMGTHGRTGLGRLLMGSVAEQIVRKATCPVLTVKTPLLGSRAVPDAIPEEEAATPEPVHN